MLQKWKGLIVNISLRVGTYGTIVLFLSGLYASSENIKVASEASLCYIDIDKCKVQLPEEMAAFPHLEAFTAEIWSILDKYSVHVPNSEHNRNTQVSIFLGIPLEPYNTDHKPILQN